MARKITLFFILLIFSIPLFSQTEIYEGEFDDTPIIDVIHILEEKYGLLFSYKNEDLNDGYISENISEKDLSIFLKNIFQDNGFDFEIVDGKYVILKKTNNLENEEPLFTFCGFILEKGNKEALIGATAHIKGTNYGAVSDIYGEFRLEAPLKKGDTLVFSYVGFEKKYIPAEKVADKGCQNFFMNMSGDIPGCGVPIIITEYLTDGIELSKNGSFNILNPNKIGALPGQAEPDIFSTINFLPGISSPTGEHANFNVRGGAADQNLILWEGIPIYQPAHYFGMISAINPYIIDEINVYRGGFGPEYGGRISGIIDMNSKRPFGNKTRFGAGLNFLNGYAYGKTPILNDKGYFVFSARHSINEIWHSPTFNNITRRVQQGHIFENIDIYNLPDHISISDQFNFFDTQLKGNINVSEKDELSAALFYAKNKFDDIISDTKRANDKTDNLNSKNIGNSFSWKHNWRKNFFTKTSFIYSKYEKKYGLSVDFYNPMSLDYHSRKENKIRERQLNIINEYTSNNGHVFSAGYQASSFEVDYLIDRNQVGEVKELQSGDFNSNIHVVHAGFESNQYNNYGVEAGFRWNHYEVNQNNYFEPRLRLWYNLPNGFTFTANAGQYYQFISQLVEIRGNQDGIEIPIWVMNGAQGMDEPVVLKGKQFQLGTIFRKNNWVIDVQAYTKEINGMSTFASGFDPNPRQEIGDAHSKGIDILLKKRWGKYRSWLSYSLSETIYKFPQLQNIDGEFPAPFDQRHSLNWVHLFERGNFEFSFGMELTSGNPYSTLKDFQEIKDAEGRDIIVYIYDEFYDQNLPFQHRADASVRYKFSPKKNRKIKGVIGLSVFNIYDKRNYYARDYFVRQLPNTNQTIDSVDKAHMGITPNMVFRLEW